MKCPHCSYENPDDASFCQFCGRAMAPSQPPRKSTQPLPVGRRTDTRPLPEADVDFAPLPVGALLGDGRYAILKIRSLDEPPFVYQVEDTNPVLQCPNCRTRTTEPGERFCESCGADLSGVDPTHRRYTVRESADGGAFASEAQLMRMQLAHPSLLLPREVFSEAPYGPVRYYRVGPEFPPQPASARPVPQRWGLVLGWGVKLADALAYLHQQHVTLNGAGLEHIVVEGKIAYWAKLSVASVIPPDARSQAASYFAQDVRGLAEALFYLGAGASQYDPQLDLPESVRDVFAQVLGTRPGMADATAFGAALATARENVRRPDSLTYLVGHRTDVGQERSLNEDSLLTLAIEPVYRSICAPVGLFVVADGMGGHDAGDVASRTAVSTIAQRTVHDVMRPASSGDPLPNAGEWLTQVTQAASRAVHDRRVAGGSDMGTTLVMALVIGDGATISNVGDSRAYVLGPDGIEQITTDHSLVERLVATGQITPQEAANHPKKNVIYRVIGDRSTVENDVFTVQLAPAEALLLCSDGLSGMVADDQLWNIWRTSTSPQEACDRMVEAANEAGGEDNVTVLILQIGR